MGNNNFIKSTSRKTEFNSKKIKFLIIVIIISILNILILPLVICNDIHNVEIRDIKLNSNVKGNKYFSIELPPHNSTTIIIRGDENSPDPLIVKITCPDLEINRLDTLELEVSGGGRGIYSKSYFLKVSFYNSLSKYVSYQISIESYEFKKYDVAIIHNYTDNFVIYLFIGIICIFIILFCIFYIRSCSDKGSFEYIISILILLTSIIWFFYSIIGIFFNVLIF